ncbi:MAG: GNAT family N-acetyltransferase [Bdellovibrionota bacterium]
MANIDVLQIKTAQEFLNLCAELLYKNEVEHSLLLGLSEVSARQNKVGGHFYIVKSDSSISGACFVSDRNLILSKMNSETVLALADQMYFDHVNFPGVVGPVAPAELFAKTWSGVTEKKCKIGMAQKIYQLNRVITPRPVAGSVSVCDVKYQDLITQWVYEFSLESLPHEANSIERAREFAVNKIPKGEVLIWCDESGNPVSMNSVGRPTKHGISVSAVYTPKALRQRGYASALVAGTSQLMLNNGKSFCVLYTDLANPTSNKIYQNIGYEEIATSVHYIFE